MNNELIENLKEYFDNYEYYYDDNVKIKDALKEIE